MYKDYQYFPIQFGADLLLALIAAVIHSTGEGLEVSFQDLETVSKEGFGKKLKIEIPVLKDREGDVMFGPDDQPVRDLSRPVKVSLVGADQFVDGSKPLFGPEGVLVN